MSTINFHALVKYYLGGKLTLHAFETNLLSLSYSKVANSIGILPNVSAGSENLTQNSFIVDYADSGNVLPADGPFGSRLALPVRNPGTFSAGDSKRRLGYRT